MTPLLVFLLLGVGSSFSLGEINPDIAAQAVVQTSTGGLEVEAVTSYDSAKKYTGHGWAVGQRVDFAMLDRRGIGLLAGLDYRYRNGGPWTKQTVWLRGGLITTRGPDTIKLLARATWDATDDTASRTVQVEVRRRLRAWMLAADLGAEWYTQPGRRLGWYSDVLVGRRVTAERKPR